MGLLERLFRSEPDHSEGNHFEGNHSENCVGCKARDETIRLLRDQILDLQHSRDSLQTLMARATRLESPPPVHSMNGVKEGLASHVNWNRIKSQLERNHRRDSSPHEDKVEQYWKDKNAAMEREAGIAAKPAEPAVTMSDDAAAIMEDLNAS